MTFFEFLISVVYFVTLYKYTPIIFVHIFLFLRKTQEITRNRFLSHFFSPSDKYSVLLYNDIKIYFCIDRIYESAFIIECK